MTSDNANAKDLLKQAGDMLSEAYDLAEDGTDKHDTIGSALDDLDFVMHQMWPNENSGPWQDGTNPMDHAADCAMFCMEVTDEEDGTHSTELVEQAEAHVWAAAMLLWGGEWKAAMDGRIQAKAQAMGISLDEAEGIDTLEATESVSKAMLKRAGKFPITSRDGAMDALMDAVAGTTALVGVLLAIVGDAGEDAKAVLLNSSKEASNATMQTMRAIGYLSGEADRKRDLVSRLEAIEDALADAITDGDAWGEVDESHPLYHVVDAKNATLELIRDIEAEA